MYYYDPDDNSRSRRGGYIALMAYAVALMCVFVFASFTIEMPNADEGILIDFGTTATGSGRVDMAMSEPAPKPTAPRPKAPEVEQDIVTSQQEDAPAVVQKPQTKPKPVEEVVEPEPKPREVNKKALFPGRTVGSDAKSEGETDKAEGNQGNEQGTLGGAHAEGGGQGTSGISYDLSGRSPIGSFQRPAYSSNYEGRVVIRIVVNAAGNVVSAEYQAKGSTTDRKELVDAALKAARTARFNSVAQGTTNQQGTITYIFKLN